MYIGSCHEGREALHQSNKTGAGDWGQKLDRERSGQMKDRVG